MKATFYSEHSHKCRVSRPCSECGEAIRKGESYTKIVSRTDGGPILTVDVCESCLAWGQALHVLGGFWLLGSLWRRSIPAYCIEVLGYDPTAGTR